MEHILLIHSSVDQHLGRLHLPAIVNSAAMITGVQILAGALAFTSFGYRPRSVIAGLYSNSMFNFFFLFFF